jgi:hypothetical protein
MARNKGQSFFLHHLTTFVEEKIFNVCWGIKKRTKNFPPPYGREVSLIELSWKLLERIQYKKKLHPQGCKGCVGYYIV